jgi:hypothetical protein
MASWSQSGNKDCSERNAQTDRDISDNECNVDNLSLVLIEQGSLSLVEIIAERLMMRNICQCCNYVLVKPPSIRG